ncbi:MAG: UbiD family decarboxylase [Hyphomicrobiales bacterium]|nr:UbiD family decarboxylase [Hyphomicrobiales bacterium]
MPYNDFREFLDALRERGELVEIDRPVDLRHDIAKALKQSYVRQGPALVFNRNGTSCPLVGGLYSTRKKALLAFQATEETIFEKVLSGLDRPIGPTRISGVAPCHEIVLTGGDIDITRFPIPIYSPQDGGPYITAGIFACRDPEIGVNDIGHYRAQILDRNHFTFFAQPFHRFGKYVTKCKGAGIRPTGAIVIGVDPVLAYTCQVQTGDDTDDWHVAGGLRGAPVELVRCKTIDLEVPATAEVIIEFEIDLGQAVSEGPLGEYTGYYTAASDKPVARITAITHRRDPYFQALLTGKPITENHILKAIPFEASVGRALRAQFPTVDRVAISPSGGVSFRVVISMQPRFAGEARQAILAAMSSNIRPKWVIAVEPDINVHDSAEVEWATCFRVRPDRDVFVIDDLPAGPLDPSVGEASATAARVTSAVGVDATRPFGEDFPQVADVPGWQHYQVPELDKP